MVEICYHVGLEEEAKGYASILGYNYNSSEWFQQSYKILNKKYEPPKKNKMIKKDKSILKKIIDKNYLKQMNNKNKIIKEFKAESLLLKNIISFIMIKIHQNK